MRLTDVQQACRMKCLLACRGGSAVSFVIALPLLLVFLFAVIDVGRTVYLHMALADAAHVACQVVLESRAAEVSPSALREVACAASPTLAASDVRLSVEVHRGATEDLAYEHRTYNALSHAFEEHASEVKRQQVHVELKLEGRYLTPLGRALSSMGSASEAGFVYHAQSSGVVDATLEGG